MKLCHFFNLKLIYIIPQICSHITSVNVQYIHNIKVILLNPFIISIFLKVIIFPQKAAALVLSLSLSLSQKVINISVAQIRAEALLIQPPPAQ